MSEFADQLKALGLTPKNREKDVAKTQQPSVLSKPKDRILSRVVTEPTSLLSLPDLGTVVRLEEERGFGFIVRDGRSEQVFFHASGFPERLGGEKKLPPLGTKVLLITGTDPRRPERAMGSAVRWAPIDRAMPCADTRPVDQQSLNALRHEALGQQPAEVLWSILEAAWYAKSRRGPSPAPPDLDDAVLEKVLHKTLSNMPPTDLTQQDVSRRLSRSPYRFAARLSPKNPNCDFRKLVELLEPKQLAAMGGPDIKWIERNQLPTDLRSILLEWHLISRSHFTASADWEKWLPGTGQNEYEIANRLLDHQLTNDDLTNAWLKRIVRNRLVPDAQAEAWVDQRPELSAELFQQLPEARQDILIHEWREDPSRLDEALSDQIADARHVLVDAALSVDLETDGERIWQVGCARGRKGELLLGQNQQRSLSEALSELETRLQAASLVVGHNIIAWDLPILSKHFRIDQKKIIWDTLLVQYLLEPQASSHALGGDHSADGDAIRALQLFSRQLLRLPPSIARGVLLGSYGSTTELIDAITESLIESGRYARDFPTDFADAAKNARRLILPEERLREFDWVPDVTVVSADSSAGLPLPWKRIDANALEAAVRQRGEIRLADRIVLAVTRSAERQGIEVRRNMLPAWLLEYHVELARLIDAVAETPDSTEGIHVSSIPNSTDWWNEAKRGSYTVVGIRDDVLVLDRKTISPRNLQERTGALPTASLLRAETIGSATLWLLRDRAAHVLDPNGGLIAFRTFRISSDVSTKNDAGLELLKKPLLVSNRNHVLHPGSVDQASYWTEVLRAFREVSALGKNRVSILLVGSSCCPALIDLLSTGLAEMGIGEVKPTHRSQREHLLRAQRSGHSVVATIDQWRIWQSLAQSAEIELQAVVEALPLEEWHASEEERLANRSAGTSDVSAQGKVDGRAFAAVDAANILEKTPALVEKRLHGWLQDLGLADARHQTVLIDPRAGAVGKSLTNVAESLRLPEAPLSPSEIQRLDVALGQLKVEREEAPSGYEAMEAFLRDNWQPKHAGQTRRIMGFKPSQQLAMEAICARQSNVLVSLPTGEGKSVLFQVPALCRGLRNRRLTLVISPLKALMRDQVERLREQGFAESVDFLSGDRPPHEIADVIQGVLDHRIVLLYVAPERLRSDAFLNVLDKRLKADRGLENLVVDEAHCINQWGYEFRPDYFHAVQLLLARCSAVDAENPTPLILLSATITASDRSRLERMLIGNAGAVGSPLPLVVRPETFSNPLREHIAVHPRRVRGYLNDKREFASALEERIPHILHAITEARRNSEATGQRSAVLVFTSSRTHAEVVAQRLTSDIGGGIDYYHAGLDSTTREEIYTRFLDGDLDVLVATKAFGMGMDIPDIHWVVHLSPPSYLEDFLQEVGRIGRGTKERERAKLEKLSALLLYSDRDFEGIRGQRAKNSLSKPYIEDLYRELEENANDLDGQRIAVLPHEGFKSALKPAPRSASASRAAATRVRMALYWLERAGRIRLCGSIADLLIVKVHIDALSRLANEVGAVGDVAGLILQSSSSTTSPNLETTLSASASFASLGQSGGETSISAGDGVISRVLDVVGSVLGRLAASIGVLFGAAKQNPLRTAEAQTDGLPTQPPKTTLHTTSPQQEPKTIALNLSQIRLRSKSIDSMGDVLACLSDIEAQGGISLQRDIEITPRKLADEPIEVIDALFDYVGTATKALIARLEVDGKIEFNPIEMIDGADGPIGVVELQKRREYERSFINGFRWLARSSGIRLRQIVRDNGEVVWQAKLPSSACQKADARRAKTLRGARSLLETIAGKTSVPIASLIETLRSASPDRRFRESDLRKSASLLASMSLVNVSTDLVPLSHVVVFTAAEGELESGSDVWEELRGVNDLAEARNLAMEVFANVDEKAREGFIQGYFASRNAEDLRAFIETQLGEITTEGDHEGIATFVSAMREKVRATKAIEFFERFKQSEEPAQWSVVEAPFDQNIIVNAGPGAGKTFVLVGRIAHLIREQNIDPAQIIVLAFNRAVVFEIRRRIRELFQSLGYAAYARRLRVSTFHSFAFRSLAQAENPASIGDRDRILAPFANRLEDDAAFARKVSTGVRCILVDEFQDMTDDVYRIVKAIHSKSGTRTGLMVIGDDDQDILRWNRISGNFSEKYFDSFFDDFGGESLRRFALSVNFRSATKIVDRSQRLITMFFSRTTRSRRIKEAPLRARMDAPPGECHQIPLRNGERWESAVEKTADLLHGLAGREDQSTAILCRSNAEVAEAHRLLSVNYPKLLVLGSEDLHVSALRHVGIWLDQLREAADNRDEVLSEDLRKRLLAKLASTTRIPELRGVGSDEFGLDQLWDLCCREQSFPRISSLIKFIEGLKTDELTRLSGGANSKSRTVVSTLHKVKGLEFDNVFILPSVCSFSGKDLKGSAAEEARLFYVGMTRAKTCLTYFLGDRENSWRAEEPKRYEGQSIDAHVLTGSMKDVFIDWSFKRSEFHPDPDECQSYIEDEVSVGDPIFLGGSGRGASRCLMHKGSAGQAKQVGFLAKDRGSGGPNAELKVAAVIRRFPKEESDPSFAQRVRERGWGYVVLVTGRLR